MIDGYIRIARKSFKEFDIFLAKQLFSFFIGKVFEVHLIVSLGGDEVKSLPTQQSRLS